ncbi:MAG TPA: hypothetical protein ENO21_02510 [Firmicutes bacterium]|nr:hypothetical protein [Bacillota bacterium]
MGQVGIVEGVYQLLLHSTMVVGALGYFSRSTGRDPRWAWLWLPLAAFAASFVAHIVAFILLRALLGDELDPWVHRPVVALFWGAATGLTFYFYARPGVYFAAVAAVMSAVGYLVFVLTRHLV